MANRLLAITLLTRMPKLNKLPHFVQRIIQLPHFVQRLHSQYRVYHISHAILMAHKLHRVV